VSRLRFADRTGIIGLDRAEAQVHHERVSRLHRSFFLAPLLVGTMFACGDEATSANDDDGSGKRNEPAVPADPKAVPGEETAADEGVAVSHTRELRGAWISTVYNGTWPSQTGLTEAAAKAELLGILDALASARMNTVFFQVRAESDAVYKSTLEPWSRFLTGTQGQDPGWDPLGFAIEEGHKRGIEIHAWLNPYRGLVSTAIAVAPNHVTKTLASAVRSYGNLRWMDPGVPAVRAHILDVVDDIVTRYDVDGIHFDDYFYPYPVAGQTFEDDAPFSVYQGTGGALDKNDWRRSNVDALVRETNEHVLQVRSSVRFGVSPFGIYKPGTPAGITGLDAYATLYCDPVKWMNEGWVDYLAPQLYWPTTQTAQAFGKLVTWWSGITTPGRSIFVGHEATKAGTGAYTLTEYDAQMKLVAAERPNGARGSIFFSAKPLVTDQAGLRTALATTHWATPAATPPLAIAVAEPAGLAPKVVATTGGATVTVPPSSRSIAIYRARPDGVFAIDRIVGLVASKAATDVRVELGAGQWALSVLDRRGVESRGGRLTLE
jgi:uncharacterized lipoprotein YddW (UPF0748 family)